MKAVLAHSLRRLVQTDFDSRSREVGIRSLGKGRFIKHDFNLVEVTWQMPVGLKFGHTAIRRATSALLPTSPKQTLSGAN
jgi:hypothetical protein